ncbi:MAG: hypothetical protein GTN95_04150, partial [Gammaproteobacteria bacterium]|nr:hypothetical protein [Gammaproteobacteria bacterium]
AVGNPDQADLDGDGVDEACDNCPGFFNPWQEDGDGDGIGDSCDACPDDPGNDADGDGLCGDIDVCPMVANPDQADLDGDGVGDPCDNCMDVPNADQAESDRFGPQQVISTPADGARSVFAADLDGDGDTDVLSASDHDDTIAWYENLDGAGNFGPRQVISTA